MGRKRIQPPPRPEIVAEYDSPCSILDIAGLHGVSYETARMWLRDYGVIARGRAPLHVGVNHMGINREGDLYAGMVEGAIAERWLIYRLHDQGGKAPFDIAGVRSPSGKAVGVEVKKISAPRNGDLPMPWGMFATHQKAWLKAYAGAGAYALAAIYCADERRLTVYLVEADDVESKKPMSSYRSWDLQRDKDVWRGWDQISLSAQR